ncbi:MAG: alpha/beta fold hydrolase [Cyclobacteriaceae bacterium]|nr:alpha/beta fold hydrolase [Cyclobacteriaceae bacterium]
MKKMISIMMSVMIIMVASCSDDNTAAKKTFVLVHGAWQAPYVWNNVKTQIEKNGHTVLLVELPAHGDDTTPPQNTSMDVYRDKVIEVINTVNNKVILVGHSMGGMVISSVAEKIPTKIEKLIYIGAFVPADNQSLLDLAYTDAQSQLGASLVPSQDQLTLDVKQENIVTIFCQDAAANQQQLVLSKYKTEPAIPFTNKVTLTSANFGSVTKYYIHTTQDHAIGIDLQNAMVKAANITKEYSLNTGHSPFLSAPNDVAKLFLEIVK